MIQGWDKFNEDNSEIPSYLDVKRELTKSNSIKIIDIFGNITDTLAPLNDMGIIKSYTFGGFYEGFNASTNSIIENDERFLYNRNFYPTPSEHDLESISDFYIPKYNGKWIIGFLSIGIDFPYEKAGWLGEEGVDLLDDIIEAKNRLKSIGYKMEMCFWQTKFTESQIRSMSHINPLEIRVYFEMDCKWPVFKTSSGKVIHP